MANKEVHVGDDWHLGENDDGDLIFYNARQDEVVKAIDVITGAEDKKSKKLENIGQLGVPGFISGNKEEGYSLNNVLPPLTRNDTGAFLSRAGSSTWKNRTYEGWEIVDTPTSYTVGSGEDYADLPSAASDLRGLILTESINLTMQENQTLNSQAIFKGMIYAGGRMNLGTGSYTLTIDTHQGLLFKGQHQIKLDGTIAIGPNMSGNTAIQSQSHYLYISGTLTIDAQSNSIDRVINIIGQISQFRHDPASWNNTGNVTTGIQLKFGARGGARMNDTYPSLSVSDGALFVKADGTVVT